MLFIDKSIADNMINVKYSSYRYQYYLFPEIKNFLNEKMIDEIKNILLDEFEESRKLGENKFYQAKIMHLNDFVLLPVKNNE